MEKKYIVFIISAFGVLIITFYFMFQTYLAVPADRKQLAGLPLAQAASFRLRAVGAMECSENDSLQLPHGKRHSHAKLPT